MKCLSNIPYSPILTVQVVCRSHRSVIWNASFISVVFFKRKVFLWLDLCFSFLIHLISEYFFRCLDNSSSNFADIFLFEFSCLVFHHLITCDKR